MTAPRKTQPTVDALAAQMNGAAGAVRQPYSAAKRTPVFSRSLSGLVLCALLNWAKRAGVRADQPQSNERYGVHQFRIRLPDDDILYRVIVAPADAPIEIDGARLDAHFQHPIDGE